MILAFHITLSKQLCSGEYTPTVDSYFKKSTSWNVFSYIIHFYLQQCFHFIFLPFNVEQAN
jgi:hypothetical protein